jgi:hypothetical protein
VTTLGSATNHPGKAVSVPANLIALAKPCDIVLQFQDYKKPSIGKAGASF